MFLNRRMYSFVGKKQYETTPINDKKEIEVKKVVPEVHRTVENEPQENTENDMAKKLAKKTSFVNNKEKVEQPKTQGEDDKH